MTNCDCLIHPFQNDPGTSQHERIMEELLAGAAKIDARTLSDLLDYFVQLSRHINYYDLSLNVSDWQPFFSNSIPFTLASIIKYPFQQSENNFVLYNTLFERRPSYTGLQLSIRYIYFRFIRKINMWHLALKDSKLPLEATIEALIRNNLQDPVRKFIQFANAAVQAYEISRIDFSELLHNEVWNLDQTDLYAIDTSYSNGTLSKFKRISNLYGNFSALFPMFVTAVKALAREAEDSLEPSFVPLTEDLQKNHPPQLALLFAFLNMFRQLQDDLNQFTRRHLDYFYRDILHFIPRPAIPDKAFVIFEIQKQLEKYLLKKGLRIKGGKDEKKQEILFALDEEIVVNKAQVADTRALFVDNRIIHETAYVGGVYMAPDVTMADGIDKPFRDDQPAGFPTLGARISKYQVPGSSLFKPYPNARLGFILASRVLFLHEGTRKVTIRLQCTLNEKICNELAALQVPPDPGCCDDRNQPLPGKTTPYPEFEQLDLIYSDIASALNEYYYYINEDLLAILIKEGMGNDLISLLRTNYLTLKNQVCYCETEKPVYEKIVPATRFENDLGDANLKLVNKVIKKRKPLNLLFSGEKEWIEPGEFAETRFDIIPAAFASQFELRISAVLTPDKPAVTFFNKENLKEDFGTALPLVKIELDDHFKIRHRLHHGENENPCCLDTVITDKETDLSLYHFFRNVEVTGKIGNNAKDHSDETQINVEVCGLKNLVVQNDESMLDVNGQMMPFGSRPRVDSNFYIGSEEILLKQWRDIYVNLNWKDKPVNFKDYYVAYQTHLLGNPPSNVVTEDQFKIQLSILQEGNWIPWDHCKTLASGIDCTNSLDLKCLLFQVPVPSGITCADAQTYAFQFAVNRETDFNPDFPLQAEDIQFQGMKKMDVSSRNGFIRITLKCQDFQHEIYPFILARQMMAFGKLPETIDGAVYYSPSATSPIVFDSNEIKTDVANATPLANTVASRVNDSNGIAIHTGLSGNITGSDATRIRKIVFPNPPVPGGLNLIGNVDELKTLVNKINTTIGNIASFAAIIPNEPWTPVISGMSVDYSADAWYTDIQMIHVYPFNGTFKNEELQGRPPLFPVFCDEGTLFVGLKDLVPGSNLNVLFKLAEATSDSESEKESVQWHYLANNIWKPLRPGFEVIEDGTRNLTTTGILELAIPENISRDNTVMPKGLHWIKASIAKNSRAVSETIGIHTQAIRATFADEASNDQLRLDKPLPADSLSKLEISDTSVKSISQLYETFGGTVPEIEQQFYVRVSERLRHKGRAIQAFDYERLILEVFPQLFKVKCINHSFALNASQYINDFPYAPGYVIAAVIPDLNKLSAGNSFEPKVPVSLIEEIDNYIRKRTSPFVRFRTMNPRYEKVNFCIRVQLVKGKDENYYSEKLRKDIAEFLAPWAVGVYDKLTFGQCVYRSDIVGFLEKTDYVDFITDLRMGKDIPAKDPARICPDTPRSILIAGDIDVCIEGPGCETWKPYSPCEGEIIERCDIKPEIIMNYCK